MTALLPELNRTARPRNSKPGILDDEAYIAAHLKLLHQALCNDWSALERQWTGPDPNSYSLQQVNSE